MGEKRSETKRKPEKFKAGGERARASEERGNEREEAPTKIAVQPFNHGGGRVVSLAGESRTDSGYSQGRDGGVWSCVQSVRSVFSRCAPCIYYICILAVLLTGDVLLCFSALPLFVHPWTVRFPVPLFYYWRAPPAPPGRHVCSRRAVQDPNTAYSEIIQGGYSRMWTCQTLLTMRAGSACLCPLGDTTNHQRPDRPVRADASSAGPRPRLMIFTYFVFALQHACSASASIHAARCSIHSTVPGLDSRMLGTTLSGNQLNLTPVRCGADRAKISAGSTPSGGRPALFTLGEPVLVFGSSQGFQCPRTMAGFWLICPRSVIGQPRALHWTVLSGRNALQNNPIRELQQCASIRVPPARSFPNMPCAFHLHPGTVVPRAQFHFALQTIPFRFGFIDIHASFVYC